MLLSLAASLANADYHIDNMCQLPESEGGWLAACVNDNDWTAGWYVYRYGWTWTWDNRAWLQASLNKTVSLTKREVVHPPRGTAAKSNKPLPVTKSSAGITTAFPDGMKIIVKSDNVHIVILPEDGTSITFDYANNVKTVRDGTSGTLSTGPIN